MHEDEDELMPLIKANLADDLAAVFASCPPSKEAAALAIAQAYHDYCFPHLFVASHAVLVDAFRDAMADTLAIALEPTLGLAATIANAIATAVNVYWGSLVHVPVIGFTGTGYCDGCPGASSLVGPLTTVFLNLANSYVSAGNGCADALHDATLTVEALIGDIRVPIS